MLSLLSLLPIVLEALFLGAPPRGTDVCSADLAALASPRFAQRLDAEQRLLRRWPRSSPALRHAATLPDHHLALTAERLLRTARLRDLASLGPLPRADYLEEAPWIFESLDRSLLREPPDDANFWWVCWGDAAYRGVAERWALHALEQGVPPTLLRRWFAAAHAAEAANPPTETTP